MLRLLPSLLVAAFTACGPPTTTQPDAGADGGFDALDCPTPPAFVEDLTACQPLATDYQPRVAASAGDGWPACVSDDNTFHPISPSISSIARVEAFEQIAQGLWAARRIPTPQDFIDARVHYAQDQGLDSRVQRRVDVHAPELPVGVNCTDLGVPAAYPERCFGPSTLLPLLNDAFARGAQGDAGRAQAGRIEAALLWFLYLSALSEATSCAAAPKDCDSCWAYATGGTPRDAPLGLAKAIRALSVETADRAYDGTLAVRCWRNLDNETGVAMDTAMQLRARGQLDRALTRGVAMVVRQRLGELSCASTGGAEARVAFIDTVGRFLDREARARDAVQADALKAALAASPVDVSAAVAALDVLFACP